MMLQGSGGKDEREEKEAGRAVSRIVFQSFVSRRVLRGGVRRKGGNDKQALRCSSEGRRVWAAQEAAGEERGEEEAGRPVSRARLPTDRE